MPIDHLLSDLVTIASSSVMDAAVMNGTNQHDRAQTKAGGARIKASGTDSDSITLSECTIADTRAMDADAPRKHAIDQARRRIHRWWRTMLAIACTAGIVTGIILSVIGMWLWHRHMTTESVVIATVPWSVLESIRDRSFTSQLPGSKISVSDIHVSGWSRAELQITGTLTIDTIISKPTTALVIVSGIPVVHDRAIYLAKVNVRVPEGLGGMLDLPTTRRLLNDAVGAWISDHHIARIPEQIALVAPIIGFSGSEDGLRIHMHQP
jgi:hypothetical protein